MKSLSKRNIIIISLIAISTLIIIALLNITIEKTTVTHSQENIIKDTIANGPESIMKYDCNKFEESQTQDFCISKTNKIKQFYSKMKWEDVKKQLPEQKLLSFNCDVLSDGEISICKSDLFLNAK